METEVRSFSVYRVFLTHVYVFLSTMLIILSVYVHDFCMTSWVLEMSVHYIIYLVSIICSLQKGKMCNADIL